MFDVRTFLAMFDAPDYPAPLDDEVLKDWIRQGVEENCRYLVICRDELLNNYDPYFFTSLHLLKMGLSTLEHIEYPIVAIYDMNSGDEIDVDEL